ncbi:AI-2E family transporter [Planctomicrobium sp.]|jgi:predicted PurR-regulated permease PerM|nr:AI-2E family transporter [Planctomicrobium sp.]MBT5020726.1 AI-2E family transporter [Planctomicrobium sp.]MDB4742912.1 AI-2E family transporter [Planctomicrobium sp.]
MTFMRRKVSLAVLLVLIIALGVTFFRVVAPFILPLFLAGMTAVVCQPLFRYFLKRTKDKITWAAALTTASIMAAILIPLITGILIAILQLYTFSSRVLGDNRWHVIFRTPAAIAVEDPGDEEIEKEAEESSTEKQVEIETEILPDGEAAEVITTTDPEATDGNQSAEIVVFPEGVDESTDPEVTMEAQQTKTFLEDAVNYTNSWLPKEMHSDPKHVAKELRVRFAKTLHDIGDRSIGRTAGTTFGILTGVAGTIISGMIGLMMYVVALYYFLADGTTLLLATEKLIPVHAKYQRQLLEQFSLVVRSVVLATFLAAFAQGVATTLSLWVFGFDHLVVLLIVATVSALIPIAGTWLVWLPCAIILFAGGHWIQASLLTIYGAVFVSFLDNVVRTYVLNNDTKLHPLLAFISILGGLQVMGLWGVFIGPIVASCLHALVNIFNHELQEFSKEKDDLEEDAAPKAIESEPPLKTPESSPAEKE